MVIKKLILRNSDYAIVAINNTYMLEEMFLTLFTRNQLS